jgi:hypothetical protein
MSVPKKEQDICTRKAPRESKMSGLEFLFSNLSVLFSHDKEKQQSSGFLKRCFVLIFRSFLYLLIIIPVIRCSSPPRNRFFRKKKKKKRRLSFSKTS